MDVLIIFLYSFFSILKKKLNFHYYTVQTLKSELYFTYFYIIVMALKGVTKKTEHHSYSISIYLQEQKMVTRA